MRLITRMEWGARPRGATMESHPIGSTLGITAHWEGPRMGSFPHTECDNHVRTIEAFHRDVRGWSDIAYNALVCPHGYVFEGRGAGVRSAANGYTQVNEDWYAVCYLGGVGDPFTDEAKQGFLDAFGWLERAGNAGPRRNGHRDHKPTDCPGDVIYAWVHSLPNGAGSSDKDWFDMATKEELREVVKEELATLFRDETGDGVDIGRARVIDPKTGKVWTLANLLWQIKAAVSK